MSGPGRRPLLWVISVLMVAGPLWAQTESASPDPSYPDPAVQRDSLLRDIQGASYYELLAWCRELGLEDAGDRGGLQKRLMQHYQLEAAEAAEPRPVRVEIVAARETDYFTVDAVQEDYVVLRGGVVVRVTDEDGESVHTIESEELVYNQTTSTMTAKGGARYVLIREGKDEVFEGESLSFDTEDLSGVFYRGSVVRERSVDGQALSFTFQGRTLSRLENDTVILDDATITSSKPVDPYYNIHVRRAWLLAEGEWALSGATLSVGRVPVFYFPFLFLPGDQLIFHPNFETRPREGTVIQTTTYLLGQLKEDKEESGSLSLLRLSDQESGQSYQRVRRGLFLTVDPEHKEPVDNPDRYVAIMADLYTRLGFMAGLDVKLPPQFSGRLGLGVSRSIFQTANGLYTPLWRDPDEGYVSIWNHTRLGEIDLPFRFGIESSLSLSAPVASVSVTASIEHYSDPSFVADFYNRSQGLQVDRFLTGADPPAATTPQKTSLSWSARMGLNLGPVLKTPALSEVAIRTLEATAFFSSRTVNTTGDPVAAVDPARSFYYPVRLRLPGASLGFRGTLLDLPRSATDSTRRPDTAPPGAPPRADRIRLPGEEEQIVGADPEQETQAEEPALPAVKDAGITVTLPGQGARLGVSYSLTPILGVEHLFAESGWVRPEDVDFATSAHVVSGQADATLGTRLSLADSLLGVNLDLRGTGVFRTRAAGTRPPAADTWARQQLEDYNATKLTLGESANVTLKPFVGLDLLKETNLSYTFAWRLLGVGLRPGTAAGEEPVFESRAALDADTVETHSLAATLWARPGLVAQSLNVTATLPPKPIALTALATLGFWKVTATARGGAKLADGEWTLEQTSMTVTVQPLTGVSLSQEILVGLDPFELARLVTTARLAGFTGRFTAVRMMPVDWRGAQTGEPEAFLPSDMSLQYAIPAGTSYFWRNRIKLERQATLSWTPNFQRFTSNELRLTMKLSLEVYQFLTIQMSATSHNSRMYLYFPEYVKQLPGSIESVNPVYDLLKSFNFFNPDDRRDSNFKISDLSLSVIHHMRDWDLSVEYAGKQALRTTESGRQWEWDRTLSFLLSWKPISFLRARGGFDKDGLSLR